MTKDQNDTIHIQLVSNIHVVLAEKHMLRDFYILTNVQSESEVHETWMSAE